MQGDDSLTQFRFLLQLYRRPLAAFSTIIDQGQFLFAAIAALAVMLLLQFPRELELKRAMAWAHAYAAAHPAEMEAAKKAAEQEMERNPAPEAEEFRWTAGDQVKSAIDIFTGYTHFSYLSGLAAIALCFVPVVILLMAAWQSMGSFGVILSRDYLSLLVCVLFAWTAA